VADGSFLVSKKESAMRRKFVLNIAVLVGGALGALLRYLVGWWLPGGAWTTAGINAVGCWLLGFWMVYAAVRKVRVAEWLRSGVGTGVLGGFTTFSTFGVDVVRLVLEEGQALEAALLFVGSLAAGVVMAGLGMKMADVWLRKERA
jgi:CrcB protein